MVPHELTDEKATRAGIRAAVDAIAAEAKPQDTLIVFLAGHGTTVGDRYFFIPHEFHPRDGVAFEAEVKKQGLSDDELGDWLCTVPAKKARADL